MPEYDGPDYDVIEPPAEFRVLTIVPYHPEPEYRRYTVPSEELHLFLSELEHDDHAERVIDVQEVYVDDIVDD